MTDHLLLVLLNKSDKHSPGVDLGWMKADTPWVRVLVSVFSKQMSLASNVLIDLPP